VGQHRDEVTETLQISCMKCSLYLESN